MHLDRSRVDDKHPHWNLMAAERTQAAEAPMLWKWCWGAALLVLELPCTPLFMPFPFLHVLCVLQRNKSCKHVLILWRGITKQTSVTWVIVTLVQTSVSSDRTGNLCFEPLTIAVLGRKRAAIYLNNSSKHFRLKTVAEFIPSKMNSLSAC